MIYVDADACPVRAEVVRVATRTGTAVAMVSNGGIRPDPNPLIQTVIVAAGPDEADRWIADRAAPGDVVVTADLPLAARACAAGAVVVKPDGTALTVRNIGPALAARDLAADLRAADPFRQGRGRAFSAKDRSRFLDTLDRALRGAIR
jgi:hypothetical protein